MPRKYTKKRGYRNNRRKYYKKGYTSKTQAIGRSVATPLPRMMKITHRYADTGNMTVTAGVPARWEYSCNSLFDPDSTGLGVQPQAFDQLGALYNHYIVIGSRITVRITVTGGTVASLVCGLYTDADTVTSNDTKELICSSKGNYRIIGNSSGDSVVMKTNWSAKKVFGRDVLGNNLLKGTPTTSPSEQQFFTWFVNSMDQSSNTGISYAVYLEQIAMWLEPKELAMS